MPDRYSWQGHIGPVLDSVKGFDVIDCEVCGFKHIVPIPTAEELALVYRHDYYSIEKPLYLKHNEEDQEWWNLVYSERYDFFEQNLPPERRRILDIGSGPGYFLLCGKKRDWQVLGIEPSVQAAAHSRELGIEIYEDFLTEQTVRQLDSFDVVYMSEVLEHIPDPTSMLKLSYSLLNNEGLLCIVVPNDYNPFQSTLRKAYGYSPWWLAPPHHINFFNFDSISHLLTQCGFKIILKEATFPIDIFLLMGENYIGDDVLGRKCHGKRKAFEQGLAKAGLNDLKRQLYRKLADIGIGREILIVGKKY